MASGLLSEYDPVKRLYQIPRVQVVIVIRKTYEQTLIASFKTLFPDIPVSSNVLYALEMQDIKDSYRRLAKRYHPDANGSTATHARLFSELVTSYEVLARFVIDRKKNTTGTAIHQHGSPSHGFRQTKGAPSGMGQSGRTWRFSQGSYESGPYSKRDQSGGGRTSSDTESSRRHANQSQSYVHQPPPDPGMKHEYFSTGEMPQKRLQLGMYLYHKGVISYQALARALAWQRSCRPPFGELAKLWGFMTDAGIQATLRDRQSVGKFGDRAMALGYLRQDQRGVVALHQMTLQPAIGRYFVANRIVTERQLMQFLAEMTRHNSNYQQT